MSASDNPTLKSERHRARQPAIYVPFSHTQLRGGRSWNRTGCWVVRTVLSDILPLRPNKVVDRNLSPTTATVIQQSDGAT